MNRCWPGHRLARRFMKQDKGSIILEGVVSLGIISVLTLGYTSVSTQATLTQRTAVNETIAVQAAQEALEKAKATNWDRVGTDVTSSVALPSGVTKITGGALSAKADPVEVRGLPITVKTAVGWHKKPAGAADFGTKIVIVEVSWQDVAGDASTAETKQQQILITPGIGEAVPAGIRGATEVTPVVPTPTPTPTPTPPPPPPAPKSFYADVPLEHVYYSDMLWMHTAGIHGGWVETNGDRNYRPTNTSARDFMAVYVYRQLGSPAYSAPGTSPFTDVATSHGFYDEIAYLDAKGILPWDGTKLDYTKPVTREEMAILFYRMAGRPAYTPPSTSPFPDVSKTDADYLEMAWVRANGIMGMYADGSFKPATTLTRDAMAVYFHDYDAKFGRTVPKTYTDIDKKYDEVNGPTVLGSPTTPEYSGLPGGGKYRGYDKGFILWSPDAGAHLSLHGPVRNRWASLGFESGWLGYPTNDGVTGLKDGGASQNFEGGVIVWSAATGARTSHGAIRTLWLDADAQDGWLGYPTTDEIAIKDNGRKQNYQGGYIYWQPSIGTTYVMGAIGSTWIGQGAENSKFGYPTSSEFAWNGKQRQNFQNGYITWTLTGGVELH